MEGLNVGIVPQVYDEIAEARSREYGDRPIAIAILGDCTFHMPWATHDNRSDLQEFGRRLNASRAETFDLFGNPTIRLDLHGEVPVDLKGKFDFVIDAGTLFCCFNVPKAWENALNLLKSDGLILHLSGLTGYIGRSYYSFHPVLFRDFYAQNGFEIRYIKTLIRRFFEERSIWRRIARSMAGFTNKPKTLAENAMFLTDASWHDLEFVVGPAETPSILPADADVLCCARRVETKPFTNAMPPYYAHQSGA